MIFILDLWYNIWTTLVTSPYMFDKNLYFTAGGLSFLRMLIFLTHAIQLTYNRTDLFCLLPYRFTEWVTLTLSLCLWVYLFLLLTLPCRDT